jgi:hypothetical protein
MERLLAIVVEALCEEAPDGSTLRDYAALLDALTILCPFTEAPRLGLFVLPLRGPSRFFGGESAVMHAVSETVRDVNGHVPLLGVADGLFCAELAARRSLVLTPGTSGSFRRSLPLTVLGRKDVATTCQRLGLHTVGSFADLDTARVAERFNKHALELHRVARGELSELNGQRDPKLAARLRQLRGTDGVGDEQMGFFGQRGAGASGPTASRGRRRGGGVTSWGPGSRGPRHTRAVGIAVAGESRQCAVARSIAGPVAGDDAGPSRSDSIA